MVLERKVEDCFYFHRFDKVMHCYGISWAVEPTDNGRKMTSRETKIKVIWDSLKKKKKDPLIKNIL